MIKRVQDFLLKNIKIISLFMLLVIIIQAIYIGYTLNTKPKDTFNGIFINVGKLDDQAKVVYIKDSVFKGKEFFETQTFCTYAAVNNRLNVYNCFQTDTPITSYKLPGTVEDYLIQEDRFSGEKDRLLMTMICRNTNNELIFCSYEIPEEDDNPYITKVFESKTKCKYIIGLFLMAYKKQLAFLLQMEDYLHFEFIDLEGNKILNTKLDKKTLLRSTDNNRVLGYDGNYVYDYLFLEFGLGIEKKLLINDGDSKLEFLLSKYKDTPIFFNNQMIFNGKTMFFYDDEDLKIKYEYEIDSDLLSYYDYYFTNENGLFYLNENNGYYETVKISNEKIFVFNSYLRTFPFQSCIFYKVTTKYLDSHRFELGIGLISLPHDTSTKLYKPIFLVSEVGKPVFVFNIYIDTFVITEKGYIYKLIVDDKSWMYK